MHRNLLMSMISGTKLLSYRSFGHRHLRFFSTSDRMEGIGSSVFASFSMLAMEHGAVNLGQGFPNFGTPLFAKQACADALMSENALNNQYSRPGGSPMLLNALADIYSPLFGRKLHPLNEIMTSVGAQHLLYEIVMAFGNPGDQMIVIEPYFDAYVNAAKVLGVECVGVPLKRDERSLERSYNASPSMSSADYTIDLNELEAAITPKTKLLVINTPHNPLGKVFTRKELEDIADIMRRHPDVIIISDEVYEHMVFDGNLHHRFATIPDMEDRTISVYSAGKTFSATGWRIGYCIAHPRFIAPLVKTQQVTAFCNAVPLEIGIAEAFKLAQSNGYFKSLPTLLQAKRDKLVHHLHAAGLKAVVPEGGYFVMADTASLPIAPEADDSDAMKEVTQRRDFRVARWLTREVKVTGIPPSAFYVPEHRKLADNLIRFCFAKDDDTIAKGGKNLQQLLAL